MKNIKNNEQNHKGSTSLSLSQY